MEGSAHHRSPGAGAPPFAGAPHPLIAHPLFRVSLVLWFAALFSLSSLAVRGAMFERWVLTSQLDLLVPAATPPLGLFARLLIAVMAGAIGAALGWGIARLLVAAPKAASAASASPPAPDWALAVAAIPGPFRVRARDAHPDAPARRPIHAHEELGGGDLDSPPGESFLIPPIEPSQAMPVALSPALPPGDGLPSDEDQRIVAAPLPAFCDGKPLAPPVVEGEASPAPAPPMAAPPVPAGPRSAPPLTVFPTVPSPSPTLSAAERIAAAPLKALSHVELVERLAIVLQEGRDRSAAANPVGAGAALAPAPAAPLPADGSAKTENALRAALASLRGLK